MSIPKVVGIEQEYAITCRGRPELTAFQASCALVNAYARQLGLRRPQTVILWDYAHETPYQDVRGPLFGKSCRQEILTREDNLLINAPLPNGSRFYTDHAHPEYSTPECLTPKEVVACDKAGEKILLAARQACQASLPEVTIHLFKNNVDHQGHSFGCHENYLLAAPALERSLVQEPARILGHLVPFLVTRQLFAGAGKVNPPTTSSPYQLSQRADFLETVFGLETTHNRPLINTRAEHHAAPDSFRRLHLILGDANLCEFATFLKIGTTQLVLMMLEDDYLFTACRLSDPLRALKQISHQFNPVVALDSGKTLRAVDIQARFLEQAEAYCQRHQPQPAAVWQEVLTAWEYALSGLRQLRLTATWDIQADPLAMTRRLDWLLKLWLLNRHRQKRHLAWDNPTLRVLDVQYHNLDPQQGLFQHLQAQGLTERLVTDADIQRLVEEPPPDTRAYFRGQCLRRFPEELFLINWEVVGFEHGEVRRLVPLLNPLKGTKAQFAELFSRVRDSRELVQSLS